MNRSIVNVTGFSLGAFGLATIGFLWPGTSGGFGSKIRVGNPADIKAKIAEGDGFLVLKEAGDRLLARLGTIAFLVGVVLWLVGDIIALDSGRFIFEFERDYVLLACLAIAAFVGALMRTRILPGGSGARHWPGPSWGGPVPRPYL